MFSEIGKGVFVKRSPSAPHQIKSRERPLPPGESDSAQTPRSRRQLKNQQGEAFKTGRKQIVTRKAKHKNAEEKLQQRDQLLKDIQRITRLGNWEWDIRANTVLWSDELYRIFGLQPQDFEPTYESYLNRVHPEDRQRVKALIESSLAEKKSFADEHRIVRPDGTVRFLETEGEVITNQEPQPIRMLGCCRDITERKQTEKKLAASLSLLSATLESTADGILVVDLAGHLVRCNRKFDEMWRLPPELMESYQDEQALRIALEQLKDPEGFLARVQFLYQHPEMESFDVLEFKDGRIFERFSSPQKVGGDIVGRVWSFRDTTERYHALETLRESEERLRSLVLATSQVVWRTDARGRVLEDNASCRKFTGKKIEGVSRAHCLDAVHPEDKASAAEAWSRAIATRSIYETEYRISRADGQWRDMSVRGVPLFGKNGEIREWIGFCHDITDRKRAQALVVRQRDFMDALVDSLPGILYVLDEKGLNLCWNKNLETVTGYSRNEIARMNAIDFVPPEEKEMLAERVKKVFSTGTADAKIHLLSKTGKHFLHYCTGTRVEIEGKLRLIGIGIDISQLEKAQEEIKKLNRDLGQRVKERTAQLNSINQELEAFSYSVSHDLRAPLRAIGGFAKVLKEDYGDRLDEEGGMFLEKILQASERMSHLIDDLLTYSRIGRNAITFHPVPLNDLLRHIANEFAYRIQSVGGRFSIADNLPVVNGDTSLLGQVFSNLLENAINYRKPDVPLQLSVASRSEGDQVVICVTDNGIGIAPIHHQRVFEVFQRLQNELPGTGIGLANVKKSVELLGGKVWVESELGQGSTFCIKLNLAEPPPATA